MIDTLHIYYEGSLVGHLHYDRSVDKMAWVYESVWQESSDGFLASLSLPNTTNPDLPIRHFLWGLLPDNTSILESWGKRFHVSPRNPFDLIKHAGEDCAGALQFIRPERVQDVLSGKYDKLAPLTKAQVKARLDTILTQTPNIPSRVAGRFSLAGAQRKDALHLIGRKWHLPEGRHPTTHILKPQIDFDQHSLNEHFCLTLAKLSGLPIPSTQLVDFGDFLCLVVKRYDRRQQEGETTFRIHQEDFCQALNIHPARKYQNEGGPSVPEIINLIRKHSVTAKLDIENFLRVLALNWVIMGTDAHAKNYSLIIAQQNTYRLAPFYDIASYLPYTHPKEARRVKFAMKYGHTYEDTKINLRQWENLANDAKLKPSTTIEVVKSYLDQLKVSLPKAYKLISKKHSDPFLDSLYEMIQKRLKKCMDKLY